MARPAWCAKQKPCDFDSGSSYCPHRECRTRLIEDHDRHLAAARKYARLDRAGMILTEKNSD